MYNYNSSKEKENNSYKQEVPPFTNNNISDIIKRNKQQNENSLQSDIDKTEIEFKTPKVDTIRYQNDNLIIPNEKKEQDRLRKLTGGYNLNKVEKNELKNYMHLKEKTPNDYYSDQNIPSKEVSKRLEEVFGPKTDFSIWNFENNYNKMNKEEQEMLVHKMQLDLNNIGYRDANGHRLKTDGIYGAKTKSIYSQYKKDNNVDLEDYRNKSRVLEETYKKLDDLILKDNEGNPIYFASIGSNVGALSKKQDDLDNLKNSVVADNKGNTTKNARLKNKPKVPTDRDKEVLSDSDYEKIQIYKAIYNYAKHVLKDDAIADSVHREAVKIRQQEEYAMHEDYGPRRIKKFDPSHGTQYVGLEGYTDGDYDYSKTNDTATIYISKPLSSSDADYESGLYPGIISNANAFTGSLLDFNILAGIIDTINSKLYPLYGKVHEGDIIVTVKKHKGGYTPTTQKEYKFYFGKDKNNFYYVK